MKSRNQQRRAANPIRESYDWDNKGILDTSKVPPRPGYVQRWVRTTLQGNEDSINLMKKYNQGWRPRMADTIPEGAFAPKIDYEGSSVIGVKGQILMERPKEIHEQQAAHNRRMTNNQAIAVEQNLFREAGTAMGRPSFKSSTKVTKGKQTIVADDD